MYQPYRHLQRRILGRISRIEKRQRIILAGLGSFLDVKQDYVMLVVCEDEVDQAILWGLYRAGGQGLLPIQIAERLSKLNVSRYTVTRRIQRMNKRLQRELGKDVAEKRGRAGPWAITSYLRKMWGATVEEAREAQEEI